MSLLATDRTMASWASSISNSDAEVYSFATDTSAVTVRSGANVSRYGSGGGAANDQANSVFNNGGYNYTVMAVSADVREWNLFSGTNYAVKSSLTGGQYPRCFTSGTDCYSTSQSVIGINSTSFAAMTTNAVQKITPGALTLSTYGASSI